MMLKSIALSTLIAGAAFSSAMADDATQALIAKGAYLARVGDCIACHTAPGGKPFSGGLPIKSDIGTIFSTNITPDKVNGIGNYTEEQFSKAVREGIRADGAHLYPAMPYPSYTKVSDADIHALYAYFMHGVTADANKPEETKLSFPFSQRWGMRLWNLAFNASKPSKDISATPTELERGAYLVEGLGHCGSCHTPRGIGMQEKAYDATSANFLSGGELNGWPVPSLRGNGKTAHGITNWSEQDIADYLGMGRNKFASVGGEMKSVVENSTAYLSDADLHAIAVYLKSLPAAAETVAAKPASDETAKKLTAAVNLTPGERLYLDNCGACHFVTGKGAPKVFPALDGASVVNAENPKGLVHTILFGAQTPSTDRAPSVLPMPAFAARLSDEEVAQLATFVRSAWSNSAPTVKASDVRDIRKAQTEK